MLVQDNYVFVRSSKHESMVLYRQGLRSALCDLALRLPAVEIKNGISVSIWQNHVKFWMLTQLKTNLPWLFSGAMIRQRCTDVACVLADSDCTSNFAALMDELAQLSRIVRYWDTKTIILVKLYDGIKQNLSLKLLVKLREQQKSKGIVPCCGVILHTTLVREGYRSLLLLTALQPSIDFEMRKW